MTTWMVQALSWSSLLHPRMVLATVLVVELGHASAGLRCTAPMYRTGRRMLHSSHCDPVCSLTRRLLGSRLAKIIAVLRWTSVKWKETVRTKRSFPVACGELSFKGGLLLICVCPEPRILEADFQAGMAISRGVVSRTMTQTHHTRGCHPPELLKTLRTGLQSQRDMSCLYPQETLMQSRAM